MAICTLKTKHPVMYDPITRATSTLFLDIKSVTVTSTGYNSVSEYYVIENGTKKRLKADSDRFTRVVAVQLFTVLNIVGNNFDEQLFNLIPVAAMYQINQSQLWGLSGSDWELA